MTAARTADRDFTPDAATLPWLLKRACVTTWAELPRVIGASALWLLLFAPLAVAVAVGPWWAITLTAVPAALVTTGLARFSALVSEGGRPRVREVFRVDTTLAVTLAASGSLAAWLLSTESWQVVGFLVAAALLVLAPFALAYGAVRGRRGLTTWRGAFILVGFRPSWALTGVALTVLGGFAIVATLGTLGLVVPVIVGVFASGVVRELLETIDARGIS